MSATVGQTTDMDVDIEIDIQLLTTGYEESTDLAVKKCKSCVEFLGFEYATDFQFALELCEDEDSLDSDSNSDYDLNRSKFVLNLDEVVKDTPFNPKVELEIESYLEKQLKMAAFDLKLANSLIPDFDGNPKNVTDFLDKCEFYNDTLNNTSKETLLQFLLKVKLLQNVKCKFKTEVVPTNFESFKKSIKDRFSDKTTKEEKINQMEKLKQENSVASFATEIENLSAELIELKMQSKDEIARPIIRSEVDEMSIRIFSRGLERVEIRQALIYKEPKSLSEAIKFALEAESKFCRIQETNINTLRSQNSENGSEDNQNCYYIRNSRNPRNNSFTQFRNNNMQNRNQNSNNRYFDNNQNNSYYNTNISPMNRNFNRNYNNNRNYDNRNQGNYRQNQNQQNSRTFFNQSRNNNVNSQNRYNNQSNNRNNSETQNQGNFNRPQQGRQVVAQLRDCQN
ncbi:GATA zinc finger domain-containing protein 4-like [Eupeodes corollae]|uniref:GATA zinc finger domain-containing protein 4-like n=1 Tax=Eupeodes corollae TaxID=290404 RepID=UPI002490A4AD|nr:GATA zinc finger domain-containing protein 4-like [Eupeodes corollae]